MGLLNLAAVPASHKRMSPNRKSGPWIFQLPFLVRKYFFCTSDDRQQTWPCNIRDFLLRSIHDRVSMKVNNRPSEFISQAGTSHYVMVYPGSSSIKRKF
mmetsp:Transcript_2526/g.3918  ORF Transcript_2526/g.3918 Transcript_2526/m.3918 type:complete len:99 (+) Transcript_2526:7733-8029(+)